MGEHELPVDVGGSAVDIDLDSYVTPSLDDISLISGGEANSSIDAYLCKPNKPRSHHCLHLG
ncbi:MAG: hypothetical protein CM1200mP21_02950 [Candidatus Poseidoniales archaeon]|nr:MAG: hypothetical protein CM1200mP21_02950 [Candidatus Poseidoniales archaeon]